MIYARDLETSSSKLSEPFPSVELPNALAMCSSIYSNEVHEHPETESISHNQETMALL